MVVVKYMGKITGRGIIIYTHPPPFKVCFPDGKQGALSQALDNINASFLIRGDDNRFSSSPLGEDT